MTIISLSKRLQLLRDEPHYVLIRLIDKITGKGEAFAAYLYRAMLKRYSALSLRQGVQGLHCVLSFDCDTPHDAEAALTLVPTLKKYHITGVFAVPATELERHTDLYQALAREGMQFMNHGYLPHTEYRDGEYRSITFYNEMSTQEVVRDIQRADEVCRALLPSPPLGFRAPHFGYFEQPHEREIIYHTCKQLGYLYCSTTTPRWGLKKGAFFRTSYDLWEFPLSGSLASPFIIMDSWNYLSDHSNWTLKPIYYDIIKTTVDFFRTLSTPALLNIYVDPAHVVKAPAFYQALDYISSCNIPYKTYPELIDLFTHRSQHEVICAE